MKIENILIRFGEPSRYDQSPYGTLCKKVKMISDLFELYIQISEDDSKPCWEKVGIFTPNTEHLIDDEVNKILSRKKV